MLSNSYKIIYADPPWSYRDTRSTRYRGTGISTAKYGGASAHYDTMSDDEILDLPVSRIAADDAALFLWATWPRLPLALATIEAWGFEYRTLGFIWVKTAKREQVTWGLGSWTRSNSEPCLLGIRGKPKRISASIHSVTHSTSSVVMASNERHSKKPAAVRDRIVELLGDLPRVELFARQQVNGWDSWGQGVGRTKLVRKPLRVRVIK